MRKLLFVDANVNRQTSRTERLARELLDRLLAQSPDLEAEEVILEDLDIAPLDSELLNRRYDLIASGQTDADDFTFARQFRDADVVVFAVPYWLFTYPAKFKAYLEAIDVIGIAYKFRPDGTIESFCHATDLYYVTTSGYKLEDRNFGFDSVRTFAQMECQIPNVRLVAAEGLDVDPQQAPRIVDEAIAGLDKLFSTGEAGSAKEA